MCPLLRLRSADGSFHLSPFSKHGSTRSNSFTPALFCLSLKMLSSWRLWTLWLFVCCQKSPQGRGGGRVKSPSKGLDSFFPSILNWVLTQISFFQSWTKGRHFFSFISAWFRGTQACVCGINWSMWCWWRSSPLSLAGGHHCLPASTLALFQALHCTILVQHDMHMWLLPSIAIKHCLYHKQNHTAEGRRKQQGNTKHKQSNKTGVIHQ